MAKRYLGGGISFEQKDVYQEFSEEESPSPGGSSTLAGLTDVDLTNPTDGQILVYDAATVKWVNGSVGSGGVTIVNAVENENSYVLDKTWQEIADAPLCIVKRPLGDSVVWFEYITMCGYNPVDGYAVITFTSPGEEVVYVAASANEYPAASKDR